MTIAKGYTVWGLIWMSILVVACRPTIFVHDEARAANAAIEFARLALLERDPQAAWRMFTVETQATVSVATLDSKCRQMHPEDWPVELSATSYQVVDPAHIYIFVEGTRGGETRSFYRVLMERDSKQEYAVSSFGRIRDLDSVAHSRQSLVPPVSAKRTNR